MMNLGYLLRLLASQLRRALLRARLTTVAALSGAEFFFTKNIITMACTPIAPTLPLVRTSAYRYIACTYVQIQLTT